MAQIFISLGSNINKEQHVNAGLTALTDAFGQLKLSSLFESEAVGFSGSPFYNLVIEVNTNHDINHVCQLLKDIELANGRMPNAKKYSPRTLDLDLLLYDNLICQTPAQIPRDEITTNAFVLWPLSELAGHLIHPVLKVTYCQLWQNYDKSSQQLRKVPLNWPI